MQWVDDNKQPPGMEIVAMISVNKLRPAGRAMTRSGSRLGWIEISLVAFIIIMGFLGVGMPASVSATTTVPENQRALFLPMVSSVAATTVNREQICELNAQEKALIAFMREHPEQGRKILNCNPILAKVARARAEDMAKRNYFSHVNPDGHGPNHLVTAAGFRLPDHYSQTGTVNNLESIGAGFRSPAEAWNAWMNSESHRTHILGKHQFYADQEEVGIGYYMDTDGTSTYVEYWVIITAPTESN